uniref:Uncharacterized protein n=1 Tax=viral metagenome TaxID=1070528 RepID=A0A6C0IFY7_9ZZZZ
MEYISSSSSDDDDDYNPIEEKKYNYNINHLLNDNIDIILESNSYNKIYLCCYEVNNKKELTAPFLQYYLINDNLYENLTFPDLNLLNINLDTDNLVEYAKGYLFMLFNNNYSLNDNLEYNGAMYYKDDIYLFFDLSKCKIQIDFLFKNSKIWLCLLDEIVNQQNICNINISNRVTNFFVNNYDLVFLYDNNDNIYETPSACYVGKNWNKLNFTHIFGVSKSDNKSILGPYYYFSNFNNAVEQCDYSDKYDKMGIIRFAVFTGVIKIITNMESNSNDESSTKKEMLNDPQLNNKYQALTSRITDHDGKWAEEYDSAYIGYSIELDDGTKLKENCLTVVKKYEQQLPLTCQYIDKNSVLISTQNKFKKYSIL